jgi:GNAT superfamily N-acetyltransferase
LRLEVIPLASEHLEPAAALLAARHRDDRSREPVLPPRFADPQAAYAALEEVWRAPGSQGVLACRDGIPVGFLLGMPQLAAPTEAFAGDHHPRSAVVIDQAHAADPASTAEIVFHLYGTLARRWLEQGLLTHYVTVPAGGASADAFFALGFGQMEVLAVRDTSPLPRLPSPDVEVRPATTADRQAVVDLVAAMLRAFAAPPTCWPFLPESLPALDEYVRPLVGPAESPVWLALEHGRILGVQLVVSQGSPAWFYPPLATPERSALLFAASTSPEARGRGIGTALFSRSLEWMREAGYAHCLPYVLTASPAAAFWSRHGFRPLRLRLTRTIDHRIAWAA